MSQQETPLKSSMLLLARNAAIALGCGVAGYFLVQTGEPAGLIIGGCLGALGKPQVTYPYRNPCFGIESLPWRNAEKNPR